MQGVQKEKVAVFVDVDNLSLTALEIVLARWRDRQVQVVMRRAYGGLEKLKGAARLLQQNGFHSRVNYGKATTDVLLTVDVMDALHAGLLPSMVAIASSDADFVPLVWRLRDAGIRVVGVAEEAKANAEVLVHAYHDMEWCVPIDSQEPIKRAPAARKDDAAIVLTPLTGPVPLPKPAKKPAPTPDPSSVGHASAAVEAGTSLKVSTPARVNPAPLKPKLPPIRSNLQTSSSSDDVDSRKAREMVQALQPWLPMTLKQLNQAGTVLREKKLVSGNKPLHEHFRQFPDVFKVLPSTGPARTVKLLKMP
jgi:hypothetical protein